MSKESSAALAALAARVLDDGVATPAEVRSLAASVLAQREPDPGNRVTLMFGALREIRDMLQNKSVTVYRHQVLPIVARGLGE